MSFSVKLKECSGLRGRFDRIARLTFREKSYSSDVYELSSEPVWDEEFEWELKSKLTASDSLEIQILNYNRLFPSKFIGRFHMYLKKLLEEQYLLITDNLVDRNSTVLKSTVTFELIISDVFPREITFESFHPVEEEERVYEDWELESVRTSGGGSRYTIKKFRSTLGSIFSGGSLAGGRDYARLEAGGDEEEGEEDEFGEGADGKAGKSKGKDKPKVKEKFNLHPKVRVDLKQAREDIDFNVQLRVIECVQLAGTQLDPICDVHCFGQVKSTTTKEQTNTPYWDEFFVFDTTGQQHIIFDEILIFKVYSGRTIISKGELLGIYKLDIGTIYCNPDHRFIRKYGCLIDPVETVGESGGGIKGYLKVDVTVLAFGDPIKEPPNTKDDTDVDANPLLPEGVKADRTRTRICVRIYKAEGLPKLNSAILAKIRKSFSGEPRIRDLADPFVKVEWAGMEAATSVRYKSYDPEWNEEIVFCDIWPTLCRRIKITVMDKDARGNEIVSTHWIDLSEISNDGCNVFKFSQNAGFMPTFGPAWINLYGSNRDYMFRDGNNFLNKGLEEGIGYRGRLLLAVATEEGESAHDEEVSNVEVTGAVPISDVAGGKEDTFQLFCCIYEATLIDRKTAKKPIRFEMNIANYGNTIDGKLVSWVDDDDEDEDEEDKFVRPLTTPTEAVTLNREYYNMPFNESKPCLHIRFMLEDQRKRLYIQNILHKFVENLEDAMEDVVDKLAIEAEDTYEFLQDALKGFIAYSDKVVAQLSGRISGPKAGRTKLDKERLALCISETKKMKEDAEELLKGVKDNNRINTNVNKTFALRDRVKKAMKEPQESTPDVFIWLLSGKKRHSYVRIPAHKIIYSAKPHECGRDSGQLQTYFLSLPGKSGLGEKGWTIQCKMQCVVWLGLLKNKKDMLLSIPRGFIIPPKLDRSTAPPPAEIVYTESHKYTLRAHLYQARGLIGSDDSGLSDAFARVLFINNGADTKVIWETRSPTWDQTLIFHDIVIWGDSDIIKENPPIIITEIFDFDEGGDIEFIGRVMSRPLVKLKDDPYGKPLFPPKLEWFDIFRGENPSGELLAAYELLELPDDENEDCNMPALPVEVEDEENGGTVFLVPANIRPVMARHRIECLFWGVREMKKINFKSVDKPRVIIDCVGKSVSSAVIESAKKNPNYPEPYAHFDLLLPEEDRYCPPLTISVRDTRTFGKEILVGTAIVSSLLNYVVGDDIVDDDGGDAGGGDGEEEGPVSGEIADADGKSGSKVMSAVGSKVMSAVGPQSILSKRLVSIAASQASVKSVSFSERSRQPSVSKTRSLAGSQTSVRALSVSGSQSSQIRHRIRSAPGTPLQRKLSKISLSRSVEGNEVTHVDSPGRRSLKDVITTPIKSIGSKLEEARGSITASQARGSLVGSLVGSHKSIRRSKSDLQAEDIELEVGAEAADFFPDELEKADKEEEGSQAGVKEASVKEEGEPEKTEAEPPPIPGLDDEEEAGEGEEEEEPEVSDRIMVGEEELKAELAALEEAAEDDDDDDEDEEGDEEDEDQVDWWSRFYETIKDEQRLNEEKKKQAKKNKNKEPTEEEDEEGGEEDAAPIKMKIVNPRIIRMKIFKTELDEVPAFDGFSDIFHSFTLLRGKSNGNDDDDESRIYGKFKGMLRVWKYPLPALFEDESLTLGSFKRLPTQDPVNILCRVYVVKSIDLHPTDADGKADPYVRVQVGKQVVKDRDNYVPKQLNPCFGRVFDFEVVLPHDNMLKVGVYDYDMVGKDDLIGETKIDIEDRYFSRHRATCGLSLRYHLAGYNKWRDPIKPAAILQRLCKDYKLSGPHFQPGKCRIEKWIFCAPETIPDENGNPKSSDEPSALKALHNFSMIETEKFKGYSLVPEHVETRSLMSPEQPGIEQGRVQLWVDLFDMDGPNPGVAADITPRKPASLELRCIIWNTEDVVLGDINILTGNPCADIYVKGWVEGMKDNKQQTDIHASSLTGEGNFNWRFIFPFKFHKAEEKVVIIKKASLFSWSATEERMPPRLVLQCWDSDLIGSDDFIGDLALNLADMPRPAKTSIQCTLDTMTSDKKVNIFKKKLMKGWWPFILNTEENPPELVGKVEAELQLLTEIEAEEDPAGLGRKEPNALPFPDRPDIMMQWMMNPLKALRYALWEQHKFACAKFFILLIIFAIVGLFMYSMPGVIVKKIVGD